MFTQDSLELLRQRIDLVDVVSSHIELKPAGAAYKALCPFHDEKSPSFMIGKGDTHYHCFGCGAHGDAIHFLMNHLNMRFYEAVETLAQRFHVNLVRIEGKDEDKGPNKKALRDALSAAARFFHLMLLSTAEGHRALEYLYQRGIDLDFIKRFQVGLAPKEPGLFRRSLSAQLVNQEILIQAGLLTQKEGGRLNDFFYDRITFPICDGTGNVIGFSARKYNEATFGGKYVNTPETPLFKKSRVLFGLHHSRKRIAKERRAIIVEGQIDALRLIDCGFNMTVASQGTAFGDSHAKELIDLGVEQIYLAFDADNAGKAAAVKVGDLFQKQGVDVKVINLPLGQDPDSFLREEGPDRFLHFLQTGTGYLAFLVEFLKGEYDVKTPAGKNSLADRAAKQIRSWENPLMVHESLRELARLLQVPEEVIGVGQTISPTQFYRKAASVGLMTIDPDRILEMDLLRWMVFQGHRYPEFVENASSLLKKEHFRVPLCFQIFEHYLKAAKDGMPSDLLSLAAHITDDGLQDLIAELLSKKINVDRAQEHFADTLQKMLNRYRMQQCEEISLKLSSGQCSDDEALELAKQFDRLKKGM